MEFHEWLSAYNAFPLEFYLDGVVYRLENRHEAGIFLNGWEAVMRLSLENQKI